MSKNLEIRQQQSCKQLMLRVNCHDSRRKFGIFAAVQSVLNFCPTATRSQRRGRKPRLRRHSRSSRMRIVRLGIKGGIRNVSQSWCGQCSPIVLSDTEDRMRMTLAVRVGRLAYRSIKQSVRRLSTP